VKVGSVLIRPICIRRVFGSNLDRDTDCPEASLWSSSGTGECLDILK